MKAVMLSIKPKYCELIASGRKIVELRKTRPKIETPFKCYIYQTRKTVSVSISGTGRPIYEYDITRWYNKRTGKVIGEFVCDKIYQYTTCDIKDGVDISDEDMTRLSCLTKDEIKDYELSPGKFGIFGWHISDLKIYDKPKELSEFISFCPEYEKTKITEKCHKCQHWIINYLDQCFECNCDGEKKLTRPPQSWCYVEEV